MKIFGLDITRGRPQKRVSPPVTNDTSGGAWLYSPYMSVRELLSNTTVAACVSIIADAAAQLTINVYRKKQNMDREIARDTDLYQLLHKSPNPEDRVPFVFVQKLLYHLLLKGNAFIYTERSGGYNPKINAIYLLDPECVEIKRDKETNEIYYKYYCNGLTYTYSTAQVLHVPAYLWDRLWAMSPLEYSTHAASLGNELDSFTDNYFKNGINSKLVVNVPADNKHWDEKDSDALISRFLKAYGGPENVHKPLITTKGLTATPINISGNTDSQLVENRAFSEKEIAKIFRVPLYMLGKDDAKFTNTEQMNTFFLQNTLSPWLVRIQQFLNTLLPVYNDDCYVEFDTDTMLRADIKSRMEVYNIGLNNGMYTLDFVCDKENIPRLPDGLGAKPFLPVNKMQLTQENLDAYMAQQKKTLSEAKGAGNGSQK